MKYILLIIILVGQCFSNFKLGFDFSSQFESGYIDTQLDNSIVFSYDHMFNGNWGVGADYLFQTEIDYNDIEIGVFDFYMIRNLFSDQRISFNGKAGYSLPDFEWENISDVDGGIMYGFDISFFNEIQISYSIHNSKTTHLFQNSIKNKCNRLTLFYLF